MYIVYNCIHTVISTCCCWKVQDSNVMPLHFVRIIASYVRLTGDHVGRVWNDLVKPVLCQLFGQ